MHAANIDAVAALPSVNMPLESAGADCPEQEPQPQFNRNITAVLASFGQEAEQKA